MLDIIGKSKGSVSLYVSGYAGEWDVTVLSAIQRYWQQQIRYQWVRLNSADSSSLCLQTSLHCTLHFSWRELPCLCYKTLTHLCQLKSDHLCCLRDGILTIHLLLFKCHICLIQRCKHTKRLNHRMKNVNHADVVIGLKMNSKWVDARQCDEGGWISPPAGEDIRMTLNDPAVDDTTFHLPAN